MAPAVELLDKAEHLQHIVLVTELYNFIFIQSYLV